MFYLNNTLQIQTLFNLTIFIECYCLKRRIINYNYRIERQPTNVNLLILPISKVDIQNSFTDLTKKIF